MLPVRLYYILILFGLVAQKSVYTRACHSSLNNLRVDVESASLTIISTCRVLTDWFKQALRFRGKESLSIPFVWEPTCGICKVPVGASKPW